MYWFALFGHCLRDSAAMKPILALLYRCEHGMANTCVLWQTIEAFSRHTPSVPRNKDIGHVQSIIVECRQFKGIEFR